MTSPRPRLLIFGASLGGCRTYKAFCNTYRVVAFLDSDPALQGRKVCGRPVDDPETLRTRTDYDLVAIGSMSKGEIVERLHELGVPAEKIALVHPSIRLGELDVYDVPWGCLGLLGVLTVLLGALAWWLW